MTTIPRDFIVIPRDLTPEQMEEVVNENSKRAVNEYDTLINLVQNVTDPLDNVPPDTRTLVIAVLTEVLDTAAQDALMEAIQHGHLGETSRNLTYKTFERAFMVGYVAGKNNFQLATQYIAPPDDESQEVSDDANRS